MRKNTRVITVSVMLVAMYFMALDPVSAETKKPTAKPILWRFNCNFSPEGWSSKGEKLFCEKVKERSGGRLIIEPYFSASLGFKSTEALSVIRKGLVEMNQLTGGAMRGEDPFVAFTDQAFLWADQDEALYWFLNNYMPVLNKRLEKKWNCRALVVEVWPGNVELYSKEPVRTFEDWQGLRVRTWGGPVMDALKAIGAEPMTVDVAELYTALRRGMISAAITSFTSATEAHFWEVLNYVDRFIISHNPWWVAVNLTAFNKLPNDLREIFLDEAEALQNWMIAHRNLETFVRLKMLTDGGMKVVHPDPIFYDKVIPLMEPVWHRSAKEAGPEAAKLLKELLKERKKHE